jgi:hypothetical protein
MKNSRVFFADSVLRPKVATNLPLSKLSDAKLKMGRQYNFYCRCNEPMTTAPAFGEIQRQYVDGHHDRRGCHAVQPIIRQHGEPHPMPTNLVHKRRVPSSMGQSPSDCRRNCRHAHHPRLRVIRDRAIIEGSVPCKDGNSNAANTYDHAPPSHRPRLPAS